MKQPHINCDENDISENVIVCGDPARVPRIANFGTNVKHVATNREFTVYQTTFNNQYVTVCSTGIGGVSALIAMEELIRCGAKNIVRVGSAGALQSNIKLGDIILVEGAVRHDGASASYVECSYPAIADFYLSSQLRSFLVQKKVNFHSGLVRSHDSFYTDKEDTICAYWSQYGVLGADMETGSILTLGRLRGVRVAALLCNVVEYGADLESSIADYKDSDKLLATSEKNASIVALEAITN